MSIKSSISSRCRLADPKDIDIGDDYYIKLEDPEVQVDTNSYSKWQVGWLLSAFLACGSYTCSNYISGTQSGDFYAGKVANSLSLGLFGIIHTIYMIRKGDAQFVNTYNFLRSLFIKKHCNQDLLVQSDVTKLELLKAVGVSLFCGLLNAVAMTFLYVAFEDAGKYGLNISICTAIVSGN